jgi:hypothetical protein
MGLDGAQMGVRALHPRPQAAAVYPGWAAADESAVPAAGPWDVREKHRAAARDSRSAAGLDFPWAVAAPLVEQGAEPPERQGQRRPVARQRVVCLERQLQLVAVRWLRAAPEQPPGEWASAGLQVPQASRLPACPLAQQAVSVPWEPFSAPQEQPPEQGSREWQGLPALLRALQVRQGQSASPRREFPGELAEQPPVWLAWYAPPSRQLPSLLSPLWQQPPPELPLLQPLEFSFVPSPQRRRESSWSASSSLSRRNWAEGQ